MPINDETEILHPELGSIRFDDGRCDPTVAGGRDTKPMWVCRPDGWDSDFEIYIPGPADTPDDLARAIEVFSRRDQIHREVVSLGDGDIELNWIDLTTEPPSVGFPDSENIYVLWRGMLTNDWKISSCSKVNW